MKDNSLDLLRLIAAYFVLFSHQYALIGHEEPIFLGLTTYGGLGVSIFFFLSGMLIVQSWLRDSNVLRYFTRRALRIFPGLIVVVLLTTFVLAPLIYQGAISDYFSQYQTWKYLLNSLLYINHFIPGVFENNPYPGAINGSLWTLPLEFVCYITIVIAGLLGLFRSTNFVFFALLLMIAALLFLLLVLPDYFTTYLTLASYFWWGSLAGYAITKYEQIKTWATKQQIYFLLALLSLISLYLIVVPGGYERTVLLVIVASLVLVFYFAPWGSLVSRRLGDISYGVYIYAFPVQQTIIYYFVLNGFELHFLEQFLYSMAITTILAYFSWHFVELKSLSYKPKSLQGSRQ